MLQHAMDVASSIIANQKGHQNYAREITPVPVPVIQKKYTKTEGPTNQIVVSPTNPARIINEIGPGGIEELIVISPSSNFAVNIEADGELKLDKTFSELSAITLAEDIKAFVDADGNYVFNIKHYIWQHDFVFTLKSTSGRFLFNQVYANYYIYK